MRAVNGPLRPGDGYLMRFHVDALMFLNLGHSPQAIYRSTERIADTFGLPQNVGE